MKYNKNNKLRLFEICAGYGSQALALNRLREIYPDFDYELVGWAEFDPEEDANPDINKQPAVIAHKVLHPDSAYKNWGDITKIRWQDLPDFDLLSYSTPCQSISQAGLQHGFTEGSGTRSSIIWNVRDCVKAKRPKFLMLENVKAMVSSKYIGLFNVWQRELEKLGYFTATGKKKGMRLITVVMGEETTDKRTKDTISMMNYGFNIYNLKTIIKEIFI